MIMVTVKITGVAFSFLFSILDNFLDLLSFEQLVIISKSRKRLKSEDVRSVLKGIEEKTERTPAFEMVSSTILQASPEWVIQPAPHWTRPCHP